MQISPIAYSYSQTFCGGNKSAKPAKVQKIQTPNLDISLYDGIKPEEAKQFFYILAAKKSNLNLSVNRINDPFVLAYFEDIENSEEKLLIADAVNAANNIYTPLRYESYADGKKRAYGELDAFFVKNEYPTVSKLLSGADLPADLEILLELKDIEPKYFIKDIKTDIKYFPIAQYAVGPYNRVMGDFLYNRYYLDKINNDFKVDDETIRLCRKFNRKYNSKIFLSSDTKHAKETIKAADKEFAAWKKASKGKAIFPKVVTFSTADRMWFDYDDGLSIAYSNGDCVAFFAQTPESVHKSLRHEMAHINDRLDGIKDNVEKDTGDVWLNRRPNYDMYIRELKKAGISKDTVQYALTNSAELIAVAAEGDMSKYSEEFKKVLNDFGMPKWVFNLPSPKNAE